MINEVTFSPIKQTIAFGEKACINGVIINPNNMPLTIQITDWNYLTNQITIPPNSKMSFKDLKTRQIRAITGQGVIIYSPDGQQVDVGIENVSVQNNVTVTFNANPSVTFMQNASYGAPFQNSSFQPQYMGFQVIIPPSQGIKIKKLSFIASPIFQANIVLSARLSYFPSSIPDFTTQSGFLLWQLIRNSQFCNELKGSNSFIKIENSDLVLFVASYAPNSVLCGNTSSPKNLVLFDNHFEWSTINFFQTTSSFYIYLADQFPPTSTYNMNWISSIVYEPIPLKGGNVQVIPVMSF